MEERILRNITMELNNCRKVALAIITEAGGSTPRKAGTMMSVNEDGVIVGTIGGGAVEARVIKECKNAIKEGIGTSFDYRLNEKGNLKMTCGGDISGYIKVFIPKPKLIIFGAGHISQNIIKITDSMNFRRIIIEDREEYKSYETFKNVDEFIVTDDENYIENIDFKDSFVVLATRGHASDRKWLKAVIDKPYKYIGVVGSKKKVSGLKEYLVEKGIEEKIINNIHMPIGLDISDGTPEEIAFSIIAEILFEKNNGNLICMKDKSKKQFN